MDRSDKIRGAIYSKYKNKSELATALGWSKQKLHNALKNPDQMKLYQIQEILDAPGKSEDPNGFSIFLP